MNGANDMSSEQDRVSAYLGGAMTPTEAAAFEREIEGDEQLAAIVERWRRNDALLQQAFVMPETEAVSSSLLDRLGLADVPPVSNVVALEHVERTIPAAQNDNPVSPKWKWGIAGSLAASVAVLATVGSFWTASPPTLEDDGAFQTALNGSASGVTVALNDDQNLTPILSFEAGDGRFCREFSMEGNAAGSSGVACKSGDKWQIEALVKGAGSLPENDEIRTAGGESGASLDAAYQRLDAGDPLNDQKEKQVISDGWKKY